MTGPVAGLTSVVVVTHCSLATIERCLDRVFASSARVEAIVVDNASDDGTGGQVARRAAAETRLRFIGNADNRGFAVACNQGAAMARGDVLLFLNPDAFIATDTIRTLADRLATHPDIGLIGCRVVDEAGRPHGPQRRREPTWWRSLMSLTGLARLERRWPALAGIESSAETGSLQPQEDVDAVNGAVMMLPHRVFERIGGFDEGFVLHAEDLDLCRRVRDEGWRVVLADDVTVTHIGGVSGRRRPFWVEWQKTRSLWRYFRKHEPDAGAGVRVAVAVGLALRFVALVSAKAITKLASSVTDRWL